MILSINIKQNCDPDDPFDMVIVDYFTCAILFLKQIREKASENIKKVQKKKIKTTKISINFFKRILPWSESLPKKQGETPRGWKILF